MSTSGCALEHFAAKLCLPSRLRLVRLVTYMHHVCELCLGTDIPARVIVIVLENMIAAMS